MIMWTWIWIAIAITITITLTLTLTSRFLARANTLPPLPLTQKTIVITGGGGGLGGALATALAAHNPHTLLILDIDLPAATATATATASAFPSVVVEPHGVDVSSLESIDAFVSGLEFRGIEVDVVINNAGVVAGLPMSRSFGGAMQRTLNVNLGGPLLLISRLWDHLARRGAQTQIVNVASTMGLVPAAGLVDYCGSKYGLVGAHEALFLETRASGLSSSLGMTLVCPYKIGSGSSMFSGVRLTYEWLVPPLDASGLAEAIAAAIVSRTEFLVLPRIAGVLLPLVSLLPRRIAIALIEFFGGRHGMDTFCGTPTRQ